MRLQEYIICVEFSSDLFTTTQSTMYIITFLFCMFLSFTDFMDGDFNPNFSRLFSTSRNSSTFGGFKHFCDEDFDFPCPEPFKKQPVQDPSIETNLQVSLEELDTGCTKQLKLTRQALSPSGQASPEEKILTIEVKPGWKAGTKVTFEQHGDQKPGSVKAFCNVS